MKIEGIPSNIEANHNHDVVVEVRLSEQTTEHIKDIIRTVVYAGVSAYAAKSAINYGADAAYRLVYLLGTKR